MRFILLLSLTACQAQYDTQPGPTFGGDQRSGALSAGLTSGALPPADGLTAAGLLSALPLTVASSPCEQRLCLSTRSAWLPSGELLVALGVEGQRVRPPVDLAFALDASGSVHGSEDVRAATVEIALDHLTDADTLSVWAFTGVSEPLVDAAPVTDSLRAEVRVALTALDQLPATLITDEGACPSWAELLERYSLGPADTSDSAAPIDTGLPEGSLDPAALDAWIELVLLSPNPALGEALVSLACTGGSAVTEGTTDALWSLPDGTEQRASRLALVSDLQGELPLTEVYAAAARGVGTSVLGVTASTDLDAMAALASAPGAHMLDAAEPSAALEAWEARFDAWMAPTSWGLTVALAETSESDWSLARLVGTTDADHIGVNAVFPSIGHGVLILVLNPAVDNPSQPRFLVQSTQLDTVHSLEPWARVPARLLTETWGEGDDQVALGLAWRLALIDAITEQDQAAWEALTQ